MSTPSLLLTDDEEPRKIYNSNDIIASYREKGIEIRRGEDAQPPRPPNAYILYRSLNGPRGWNSFPADQRRFWEETAEALKKQHKLIFPDYTFRRGPDRRKLRLAKQPYNAFSSTGSQQRLRLNSRNSDNANLASEPLYLQEESYGYSDDGVSVGSTNMRDPCSNTLIGLLASSTFFESPLAAWESVKLSYQRNWGKSNKRGQTKCPPNSFVLCKSALQIGAPKAASCLWNSMTDDEKDFWFQVAEYAKKDHQAKFPEYEDGRAQTRRMRNRVRRIHNQAKVQQQYHPEQELSTPNGPSAYIGSPLQQECSISSYAPASHFGVEVPLQPTNGIYGLGRNLQQPFSGSLWWDNFPQFHTPGATAAQGLPFPTDFININSALPQFSGEFHFDAQSPDLGFGAQAESSEAHGLRPVDMDAMSGFFLGLPSPDADNSS